MTRSSYMMMAALGAALGVGSSVGGAAMAAQDPTGTWVTQDGRARIRMEKCGSGRQQLCGYVVWIKPGSAKSTTDRYNPDSAKTSRPVIGHQLILGLSPNADARFAGQIYNSEDGKKYDVEVWAEGPNDVKVKGCLVAFLCSTQSWTRATDVAAGQLIGQTGAAGGPTPDPEWASSRPAAAGAPTRRDAKPKS